MTDHDVVVLRARRVLTLEGPDATAVAMRDGHVLDVGHAPDLLAAWPGAREVALDGVVLPGFHDAHLHVVGAVQMEQALDASPSACPDVATLLAQIARRASETPRGAWVRVVRYDDSSAPDASTLDRAALDAAAPEHPVLVTHVADHWGVANSAALREAGYLDDAPDPAGGEVARDAAGQPTGYLYETAHAPLRLPQLTSEEWIRCAGVVSRRFHAAGLTSVGDAWILPEDVELLRAAEAAGELTLRVAMLVAHTHFDPAVHLGRVSERLAFAGVKWFADGAIGGRTALLDGPYADGNGHGIEITSPQESEQIAARVHAAGGRVAIHANGDRAIRALLVALEAVARRDGPLRRPRIEHCSLVDADIVARLRRLGAVALPFAAYTRMYGGKLVDWYGEERVERMFPARTLLDAGVPVGASTDHPVAPFEPLNAIQAMVTRAGRDDGRVVGASQRVSVEEALRIYTRGAAFAEEAEDERGRIAPGMCADFTVLEQDPRAVARDALAEVPVLATIVGGALAWSADGVEPALPPAAPQASTPST